VKFTGNTRYRVGWRGRLILQAEYEYRYLPAGAIPSPSGDNFARGTEWRDANVSDVLSGVISPNQPEIAQ
jgi:hypothetical protein